jgi:hypothetical protein
MVDWSRADWFVELAGIADAWLWPFDIDGRWRLRHGDPAMGSLAVLPWRNKRRKASLTEVAWIADCLAYDHDAPVGVSPNALNRRARFPNQPIIPHPGENATLWYFRDQLLAYEAVAEMRFGNSYLLRYDPYDPRSPTTDFDSRFLGRESLVSLYAMAARQADLLSEFLCLYRVLEAADGANGTAFIGQHLGEILDRDFGFLGVAATLLGADEWTNVFDVYRRRARNELARLRSLGTTTGSEVASHLYRIRNSLAHGKRSTTTGDFGPRVAEVAGALHVIKLLARLAVEPECRRGHRVATVCQDGARAPAPRTKGISGNVVLPAR